LEPIRDGGDGAEMVAEEHGGPSGEIVSAESFDCEGLKRLDRPEPRNGCIASSENTRSLRIHIASH
jgi:hypothetical protein